MSSENLTRLFSAASEFDASDLHLVAGVPPAYRVAAVAPVGPAISTGTKNFAATVTLSAP